MRLYNMALESIKRYKERGEQLTDFDDFISEIEREYSTRTYKVILTPDNNGYMVTVPDFNCNTQGRDKTEALEMARDVIKAMSEVFKEMGKEIPTPNSINVRETSEDVIKYIEVEF